MMNTLEDLSLACCVSMCCISVFGFFFISAVLRRTGRGFGDIFGGARDGKGGGLLGLDFGGILDMFFGGDGR